MPYPIVKTVGKPTSMTSVEWEQTQEARNRLRVRIGLIALYEFVEAEPDGTALDRAVRNEYAAMQKETGK